jgi:hypothetical protein
MYSMRGIGTVTFFVFAICALLTLRNAEAQALTRVVSSAPISVNPGATGFSAVFCGTGEVAVGGGFSSIASGSPLTPVDSFPESLNPGESRWTVGMHNPGQTAQSFRIHAICAVGIRLP